MKRWGDWGHPSEACSSTLSLEVPDPSGLPGPGVSYLPPLPKSWASEWEGGVAECPGEPLSHCLTLNSS